MSTLIKLQTAKLLTVAAIDLMDCEDLTAAERRGAQAILLACADFEAAVEAEQLPQAHSAGAWRPGAPTQLPQSPRAPGRPVTAPRAPGRPMAPPKAKAKGGRS